jgi:predicted outer membrane protein
MLPLGSRRSARLLVGAAVVAVVIGGSATVSPAAVAPAAVPQAGDSDSGIIELDPGTTEELEPKLEVPGEGEVVPGSGGTGTASGGNGSATGDGARAPLLPSDVDLLVKARLAGLWEMPAGRMAEEKGTTERVREIGKAIADQHVRLDELCVNAANTFGVQLPTEPTNLQKVWLKEMEEASGKEFDRIYVDRLRDAHGAIYPVIAMVRASTRNAAVRKLADQASGFVDNHMLLLESTGLVDYTTLEKAPEPDGNPVVIGTGPLDAAKARAEQGGVNLMVIWALLLTCLLAGAVGTARFLRPRWGVGRFDNRAAVPMPTRVERPTSNGQGLPPSPGSGPYDDSPAYPRPLARPRS